MIMKRIGKLKEHVLNHKLYWIFMIFLMHPNVYGQTEYLTKVLKEITSPNYAGRGYTHQGMDKAAEYLAMEYKNIGLKSYGENYFQEVQFPINVIHNAHLKLNGKQLIYGKDFILKPSSKSIQATNIQQFYTFSTRDYVESFKSKEKTIAFIAKDHEAQKGKHIILPPLTTKVDSIQNYYKQWANIYEKDNLTNRAIFRFTSDSLIASLSQRQANVTEFIIKSKYYSPKLKIEDFGVEAEFNPAFTFKNIIGYVEGENNDSTIVISGHYDHLGQVGASIFPGASDNGSGTAMVMELANYFAKHKPKYRIAFMLFGAEEAGIVGSYHYVNQPLFPLNEIKFLVNLDIMGAGEDGIQVVNGTKFTKEFNQMVQINKENQFLKEVKVRGESCNSDHCPFDKKGVPSIFIYTLGGKGNYHNIYDTYANLDLSHSEKVKNLLIKFINQL